MSTHIYCINQFSFALSCTPPVSLTVLFTRLYCSVHSSTLLYPHVLSCVISYSLLYYPVLTCTYLPLSPCIRGRTGHTGTGWQLQFFRSYRLKIPIFIFLSPNKYFQCSFSSLLMSCQHCQLKYLIVIGRSILYQVYIFRTPCMFLVKYGHDA